MSNSIYVKITGIEPSDILEGIVKFKVDSGNEYHACYWGKSYVIGEYTRVQLSGTEYLKLDFDRIFDNNNQKEKKLIQNSTQTKYTAYGQIVNINPVTANFGDFALNIGNWSNDPKIIGEYICIDVPRLEIAL